MRSKEAALRPSMKWEVEDMLSLESIADSTYDAVVDKVPVLGILSIVFLSASPSSSFLASFIPFDS
jgi:hypothetical protein